MARATYFSLALAALAAWWAMSQRASVRDEAVQPVPTGRDPERTIDVALLDKAVSFPVHVEDAKETVLLVHGTGMT
jgi:hypothetical protein